MKMLMRSIMCCLAGISLVSCGGGGGGEDYPGNKIDAPSTLQGLVLVFKLSNGEEMVLNTTTGNQLQWGDLKFTGAFDYSANLDSDVDSATLTYGSLTATQLFTLKLNLVFDEVERSGLDVSRVSGRIGNWSYEYKKTSLTSETLTESDMGVGGTFAGSR